MTTARFFISACDDSDSLTDSHNPRQRTWDIIDRNGGPDCAVGNYTSRKLAREAAKALNDEEAAR